MTKKLEIPRDLPELVKITKGSKVKQVSSVGLKYWLDGGWELLK